MASTGGHLAQLRRFSKRMNAHSDSLWVTTRTPQSESLLEGCRVLYLPYVGARDPFGVLRTFRQSGRLFINERFDVAISTGSAFAIGVFAQAALHHVPRIFVESVSRVTGPSMSGRIIALLHLADLYTQHKGWATGRWKPHPSVLAEYAPAPAVQQPPPDVDGHSVFVTLGTFRRYRFDSLVEALLRTGLVGPRTTWQLGATDRSDLPGRVEVELSAAEFETELSRADVVVTHAGVGTILSLLEAGRFPVVVPRRRARHEHVDDHQSQIADLLRSLGIARVVEAPELTREDLLAATTMSVVPRDSVPLPRPEESISSGSDPS
ncbi:glycosyltransferase [Amnibacterium sp. CER49]|uniref:glycosyltransferase n=1 Tax=Amnibacterium sp. CER49 TaxID=3039161 RepID=UPI002449D5B3|nr:glycosyltransferase [Amnibacterium sp. CER49]MDH2443007.1 glycosyltransferase [Amnibacterium sp. CER49]